MATYTVQAGDTLASIASRELGDPLAWFDILQANPQIKNPDLIYPGQVLELPPLRAEPVR
jgi:nucleoid-associated protein YgaU